MFVPRYQSSVILCKPLAPSEMMKKDGIYCFIPREGQEAVKKTIHQEYHISNQHVLCHLSPLLGMHRCYLVARTHMILKYLYRIIILRMIIFNLNLSVSLAQLGNIFQYCPALLGVYCIHIRTRGGIYQLES